ncbi:ATP-binding cassette domain-containing protein [Brachybacterium tyrofermentans]|uniref:ATP-binding cassette domain-containing protein n=1 Tax=Brachybacterium tyrofermentans TaxID=47848 RepID=UPI00186741A2|nr:ABC transporter ATP-binding protein [Brachybacterium tyrofermentans]
MIVRQRSATELGSLGTSERVARSVRSEWTMIQAIMGKALRPQTIGSGVNGLVTSILLSGAMLAVVIGSKFDASSAAGIYGVLAAITASSGAGMSAGIALELVPQISRLRDFIEAPRDSRERAVESAAQLLVADDIYQKYSGRDEWAVNNISLSVKKGEIIALVGPNGAGKTSLVNTLTGLVARQSGDIRIDDRPIGSLGEADWLAYFSILTQEFGRYELTVREVVCLGSPAEAVSDESVWSALEAANAAGFVRQLPSMLDHQLGEQFGGTGVSGGQWQRLALARIYLRDAPIWILDEPTSAIDAEAEERVFSELVRTKSERITIVVSHRAWTLREMDTIYVVDDGRIVEAGSHSQLIAKNGRFAELFAAQHS